MAARQGPSPGRFSEPSGLRLGPHDVLVNVAIILMAVLTRWTASGWPDLMLGFLIILLALHAAHEVWEISEEERLAARALSGEPID